jgi:hypothetical protein
MHLGSSLQAGRPSGSHSNRRLAWRRKEPDNVPIHCDHRRRSWRAFIPARLPPEPPIQLTGEFQRLLSQADLALGRLDGSIHHQAQTVDIRRLSLDELPPDIYIVL